MLSHFLHYSYTILNYCWIMIMVKQLNARHLQIAKMIRERDRYTRQVSWQRKKVKAMCTNCKLKNILEKLVLLFLARTIFKTMQLFLSRKEHKKSKCNNKSLRCETESNMALCVTSLFHCGGSSRNLLGDTKTF